jgi:hypothetical protein
VLLTPATASSAGRGTTTASRWIDKVRARRGDARDTRARSLAAETPATAPFEHRPRPRGQLLVPRRRRRATATASRRRAALLRLVADEALDLRWEVRGWRLHVIRRKLQALADGEDCVRLSLPTPPVLTESDRAAERTHALAALRQAHRLRTEADQQERAAVYAYCSAGGSIFDPAFCAAVTAGMLQITH